MNFKIIKYIYFWSCAFSCCMAHNISEIKQDIVVNNVKYSDQTVADLITVIISTNPIPSMPETDHIQEALYSLHRIPALAQCKKIIVFDGIQPLFEDRVESYNKYKMNIAKLVETDERFSNVQLLFLDKWSHLVGAVTEALKLVKTPFVFIHQHDLILQKYFFLNGIIATMVANPKIKHVRLNKRENYLKSSCNWKVEASEEFSFVPLCKSYGWTDQTHVARLEYYTDFVLPQCNFGFMEQFLNPNFKKLFQQIRCASHDLYGTYLYGDLTDGCYIYHSDGAEHNLN